MPRDWSFVITVAVSLVLAACASPRLPAGATVSHTVGPAPQAPPLANVPASSPSPSSSDTPSAPNVVPSPVLQPPEATELSVIEEPPPESNDQADSDQAIEEELSQAGGDENADGDSSLPYDVPIVLNASVEKHIEYFSTKGRDRFELWLNRSGRYRPLMTQIFRENGLPEDLVFVSLIESGFNPYAYSRSHAVGAWQFIKGTGRKYGLRVDRYIDERRDVVKSTQAAAAYLKDLYAMFDSWPLALASYNAGERRVERAIKRTRSDDFWDLRATRHLHPETRNYVPKFMAATIIAKNPEKYGFSPNYEEPFAYDEVVIERPTDLRVIAKAASVTYGEVKRLNPELRRNVTPLGYKEYRLKLPMGTKAVFEQNFAMLPEWNKTVWMRHTVGRGETLSSIARRFGTSTAELREMNQLASSRIRAGSTLLVPTNPDAPEYASMAPAGKRRAEGGTYRVQRGDTLWEIAKDFDVQLAELQAWNRLDRRAKIHPGQHLLVQPDNRTAAVAEDASPSVTSKPLTYRVKRGDTLWDIAKDFDVRIADLRAWNSLNRRSKIHPGQHLVVQPDGQESARVNTASLTGDAPAPKRLTYRVKRGDTLWSLSKNFGVPISDIRKWNRLGRSSTIKSGQRLVLYVNAEQS